MTIKLKTATITVQPGQKVPVSLKLSSAVRKKYAGKTLTATITVTARDASGNVKKTKATRTVKLAKLKKSKAHKKRSSAPRPARRATAGHSRSSSP